MWFVRIWVPLAIAATFIYGLIFAVGQLNYRQSFNDPQIHMAEDTAALLIAGEKPMALVPKQKIDIANSIAPWFAVYSATGTPVASSGVFNGALPQPPAHIFADVVAPAGASTTGQARITWEPAQGIRQAIVVVSAGDFFVVAGRNLREVEGRIWTMELMIGFAWLATLLATLIAMRLASRAEDFITYIRG